jgi:glycosyltransferase involved in cell wall biosynthesis
MYQWLQKINWDHVDKLILVSHAKQQEFVSEFPDQASKVIVIPEAITIDKFPLQTKEFNGDIGILCHLRPRKRVYELILAFSELIKLEPSLHLHIGGGEAPGFKEYKEALQVLVRKLEIKDKITFYGHVTNPTSWFGKVDIFVSNSYSEGLQVSPMEAIASGCYCISHHWDGADELLSNEDIFFTEHDFVSKVISYVKSSDIEKNLRKSIQRNHVIENFDVNKTRLEIRKIIEESALF